MSMRGDTDEFKGMFQALSLPALKAAPAWCREGAAPNAAKEALLDTIVANIADHPEVQARAAEMLAIQGGGAAGGSSLGQAALAQKVDLAAAVSAAASFKRETETVLSVAFVGNSAEMASLLTDVPKSTVAACVTIHLGNSARLHAKLLHVCVMVGLQEHATSLGLSMASDRVAYTQLSSMPSPLPIDVVAVICDRIRVYARSTTGEVYRNITSDIQRKRMLELADTTASSLMIFCRKGQASNRDARFSMQLYLLPLLLEFKLVAIHEDHVGSDQSIQLALSSFVAQQASHAAQQASHAAMVLTAAPAKKQGAGGGGGGGGQATGGGPNGGKDKEDGKQRMSDADFITFLLAKTPVRPFWATKELWSVALPATACLIHREPLNRGKRGRSGFQCTGKRADCTHTGRSAGGKADEAKWKAGPVWRYLDKYGIAIPLHGESPREANGGADYKG